MHPNPTHFPFSLTLATVTKQLHLSMVAGSKEGIIKRVELSTVVIMS